jgi:hypothetical protein
VKLDDPLHSFLANFEGPALRYMADLDAFDQLV